MEQPIPKYKRLYPEGPKITPEGSLSPYLHRLCQGRERSGGRDPSHL